MRHGPISLGKRQMSEFTLALSWSRFPDRSIGSVVTPCLPGSGLIWIILVLFWFSSSALTEQIDGTYGKVR